MAFASLVHSREWGIHFAPPHDSGRAARGATCGAVRLVRHEKARAAGYRRGTRAEPPARQRTREGPEIARGSEADSPLRVKGALRRALPRKRRTRLPLS